MYKMESQLSDFNDQNLFQKFACSINNYFFPFIFAYKKLKHKSTPFKHNESAYQKSKNVEVVNYIKNKFSLYFAIFFFMDSITDNILQETYSNLTLLFMGKIDLR